MQSTIKSTLSLLISLARPQGPVLGSEVMWTGRPPLTLKPIFAARDEFTPGLTWEGGQGSVEGKIRCRMAHCLHSGLWIYCTQGEPDKSNG